MEESLYQINYQIKHFAETNNEELYEQNEWHTAVEVGKTWRCKGSTVVLLKMQVFWDATSYRSAKITDYSKDGFAFLLRFRQSYVEAPSLDFLLLIEGDAKTFRQAGNYLTVDTA